jgi:hypothetical protein
MAASETRTIVFGNAFKFSHNGQFIETNSVTVTAPGHGKFNVHNNMKKFVGQSQLNFVKAFPGISKQQALSAVNALEDEQPPVVATDDIDPEQVIQQMSMGLGDEFPRFMDYTRSELTGSPKLCSVGDEGAPMTDGAWKALAEANGIESWEVVIGTFAGFFSKPPKSKKPTGKSSSGDSPEASKAELVKLA